MLSKFQSKEMEELTEALPCCPITLTPVSDLRHPVVAPDGFFYEESEIKKYLSEGVRPSPMTRQPLQEREVLNHHATRVLIKGYNLLKNRYEEMLDALITMTQQHQREITALKAKHKRAIRDLQKPLTESIQHHGLFRPQKSLVIAEKQLAQTKRPPWR